MIDPSTLELDSIDLEMFEKVAQHFNTDLSTMLQRVVKTVYIPDYESGKFIPQKQKPLLKKPSAAFDARKNKPFACEKGE